MDDKEYWDDEFEEEFHVRERAEKLGIPDTPELRKYIASKDSFSITDEELEEEFLEDE